MWRILITLLALTGAVTFGRITFGQQARQLYGPFDAVAEGTQNAELRRLSLIDSQLDTVDQLRSSIVTVAQPRVLLGRPDVAVYPYGRRGILGLRPQGYVVVPRSQVVVYRRTYVLEPPAPPVPPAGFGYGIYGDNLADQSVRQPLGHESLQTGPNRWEYRPLYADDERRLDEIHGKIERNLRPIDDDVQLDRDAATQNINSRSIAPGTASEPEELPVPPDAAETRAARPAAPVRGQARDIARSAALADQPRDAAKAGPAANGSRRDNRVPPPPRPDPSVQPRNSAVEPKATTDDTEPRGPLLQNPSTGAREF